LKEEALDRTIWSARFGRGFGPLVKQTTKRMNESSKIHMYLITTTTLKLPHNRMNCLIDWGYTPYW